MTQKKSDPISHTIDELEGRKPTRIYSMPPDLFDPSQPRLGRRESEPHSIEITYIHDVLTTNFPESRTIWDLHHYFTGTEGALKGKKIDIQFDVSFFKDFNIPHTLSSYEASKYEGRVPDMAINILSKSTWKTDLSENLDTCKELGILVYVLFSPFKVASKIYYPPFLRVYILQEDKFYKQEELRTITLTEGGKIKQKNTINISNKFPFRLGLMKLNQKHEGGRPLFRLIFIDPSGSSILPTREEKKVKEAEEKAKEAEEKAKEEEEKAKEAEEEAKKSEEKAEKLEREIKSYREKLGEL